MLSHYKDELAKMKSEFIKGSLKREELQKKHLKIEKSIESEKKQLDILMTQKELLNEASKEARRNAKEVLENISTKALHMIYGENVSMVINLDETKNPVTAEIEVHTEYADDVIENDPKDADGGGMADICSLSNLISLNFLNKQNKAFLALDEPTKFLSQGYSSLDVAKFLYEVSHSLNKQIFLVTHDVTLLKAGDINYLFELDSKGVSKVRNQNLIH